jgi:hypothetical protein
MRQLVARSVVRMVAVAEGCTLRIGAIAEEAGAISGIEFPVAQVSTPSGEDGNDRKSSPPSAARAIIRREGGR